MATTGAQLSEDDVARNRMPIVEIGRLRSCVAQDYTKWYFSDEASKAGNSNPRNGPERLIALQ
jgi:hypothetical protein